jgi:hypothetical protein
MTIAGGEVVLSSSREGEGEEGEEGRGMLLVVVVKPRWR